jgi:hypothetical protein
MLPVVVHVFAVGLKSSALDKPSPPATSTRPLSSKHAAKVSRATFIDATVIQMLFGGSPLMVSRAPGTYNSAEAVGLPGLPPATRTDPFGSNTAT